MKPIPKNLSLPLIEEEILAKWEREQTFAKSNQIRFQAKEYSFYDGPPFANGLPHYGHLLANTIKDTVPRYWNMRGYAIERRFGWDCHGLPVEFEIEKREGLKGRTDILALGVDRFNEMCRESVLHYTDQWRKTITRLGRWVDWSHQYRTMDVEFMESVWWVFKSLFERGLVYQGYKVVPYSPRITAVLSNFEANQNYQEVQDPAITVRFKLKDEAAYLLAWTTTPWTLTANLALAVGPELTYLKVRHGASGEIYYCAKERIEALFPTKKKSQEPPPYEVLEEVQGHALVGRSYEPLFPFYRDRPAFRVLAGDFVTIESGTGIVHCAPAYGEDDHRVCTDHGIDLVDPLDEEARFLSPVESYLGLYIKEADKKIIADLKSTGDLVKQDTIVHSYPFCERSDEPLIYRAIPAWFVRVEEIKEGLIRNNQAINWVPEHLKNGRMGKWLENARDWAISRNRFWGTPIPIWICKNDAGHRVVLGSKAELETASGEAVTDLHKHFIDDLKLTCTECGGVMTRIPEVFDCWFESGSMPYAQLHYPFEHQDTFAERFPADFIAEGLDQTRGWFYTLSILSEALFQKPAFKNVVVNGLILASDGKKMSKRWRNFSPPEELFAAYGADAVRLYMLNSAILRGEDLRFKDEGVKETIRSVILPLWHAYGFLSTYAHADGYEPSNELWLGEVPKVTGLLDRWILSRLQTLIQAIHHHMEGYRLFEVVPQVLSFIEDLTNWYIRLSRRRFWSEAQTMSSDTKEAYETLFHVIFQFLKIFAPFAPFQAEALYVHLKDQSPHAKESIHLHDFPEYDLAYLDELLETDMALVRRVCEMGRSLRAKHQIKTRQVLPSMLIITKNARDREIIEQTESLLKGELNLKAIEFSTDEWQYVHLTIKPNLRTLGKKLGKSLKAFKTMLLSLSEDQEKVAQFLDQVQKGEYLFEGVEILEADLLFDRGPKDERLIDSDLGVTVLLDTRLTPMLIHEGMAREVVNRVQNLRKEAGLHVSDRIELWVKGPEQVEDALNHFKDYIKSEVLASVLLEQKKTDLYQTDVDIDGMKVEIGLKKIG